MEINNTTLTLFKEVEFCEPLVIFREAGLQQNISSLCDTLIILQQEEHAFIFMLGIIAGIIFIALVFLTVKMLSKNLAKESKSKDEKMSSLSKDQHRR